jgi:hypothetical protein
LGAVENWSDFDSEASYGVQDDEREWSQDQFTAILQLFRDGFVPGRTLAG